MIPLYSTFELSNPVKCLRALSFEIELTRLLVEEFV